MLRLLKITLLLVLIIGSSIGGTVLLLSSQGNLLARIAAFGTKDAAPAAKTPEPIFAKLEPFTATLEGEYRNHILYIAITLRLADPPSRKIIEEYMPEVRDRILRVLASQNNNQIQTVKGREALVNAIKTSLQIPFAPQRPGPHITSVLFTEFVIQ
ncbi:MAG: flagellar basal body-associated FliL family protein [Nitrosospira sp.]|nr:flagellar basal body-associated FliL family protein [Nitrosospira sp.]